MQENVPTGRQLSVLGRGVDVSRRHNSPWVVSIILLGVGRVVRFTAAEFHASDNGSLEFASGVSTGALAAGNDPDKGPAHLLAGQSVNDGVGARVEHRQHQEVLRPEEDVAGLHLAAHVQQEQNEEGCPAGDEDAQDDNHGLEQRQRLLRAAAGLRHVLAEGQSAAPSPDQGVDPAV